MHTIRFRAEGGYSGMKGRTRGMSGGYRWQPVRCWDIVFGDSGGGTVVLLGFCSRQCRFICASSWPVYDGESG